MSTMVLLNSVAKIGRFQKIVKELPYEIDLVSGKHTYLDAKSVIGILSGNISEPFKLETNASDEEFEMLLDDLEEFIVPEM